MHLSTVATKRLRPPVTAERLVRDLRGLGVESGQVLIVHASLASLGWVIGGAPAVASALRKATPELIDVGELARYDRPMPTLADYDELLSARVA